MRTGDQELDAPEPGDVIEPRLSGTMLILVSGLPGVGKSVLVQELAPRLAAGICSRDAARLGSDSGSLRRAVEALVWRFAGRRLASTQQRAGRILESAVAEQLESNGSVIVEAVAEDALRQRLQELALQYGATFVQVECVLSDRSEHHRRLGLRAEGEQFWLGVVGRIQKSYQPPPDCVRIDTQAAPDELAERILAFVRSD